MDNNQYSVISTPSVCGGALRVQGTRIPVQEIWLDSQSGLSPAEIANSWEGLELPQVHVALQYCAENKDIIKNQIQKYSSNYEEAEKDCLNLGLA